MNPKLKAPEIRFYESAVRTGLKNRRYLKEFLIRLFKTENTALQSLVYVFCTDEQLLQINIDFLKHDDFTDIITFSLSDKNDPVVGEVYISFERVQENAKTFEVPVQTELLRVVFHGALHLCGYTDKNTESRNQMTEKEDYYIKEYAGSNVPRGTL